MSQHVLPTSRHLVFLLAAASAGCGSHVGRQPGIGIPRDKRSSWRRLYVIPPKFGPNGPPGHDAVITSVAFSPDGKVIATGGCDDTIMLWESRTGRLLRTIRGHTRPVFHVAFTSRGDHILSSALDGTLRLWDAKSGRQKGSFKIKEWTLAFAVSPDDTMVAIGCGGEKVKILARWGNFRKVLWVPGGDDIAFSPDGKMILSCFGKQVFLWDASTGENLATMEQQRSVTDVAFVPQSEYFVAWCPDPFEFKEDLKRLELWDIKTRRRVRVLSPPKMEVAGVAVSKDGKTIIWVDGRRAMVWDVRSGRRVQEFLVRGSFFGGREMAMSPDGKLLAVEGAEMGWQELPPEKTAGVPRATEGDWVNVRRSWLHVYELRKGRRLSRDPKGNIMTGGVGGKR